MPPLYKWKFSSPVSDNQQKQAWRRRHRTALDVGWCLKPSLGPACQFGRFLIKVNVDSVRGTERLTSCVDADFTAQIWNDTWGKRITSSTQALNDKAVIICVLKCCWVWCWRPTSMGEFSLGVENYSDQLVVVLMYSMWVLYASKSMAAFPLSCSNKRPLLLIFLVCTHSVCHLLSLFLWHRCWHLFFLCLELLDEAITLDPPPSWAWFQPISALRFRRECWSAHWDPPAVWCEGGRTVGEEMEGRKREFNSGSLTLQDVQRLQETAEWFEVIPG